MSGTRPVWGQRSEDCEPIFHILDSDHGAGDGLVPLVKLQEPRRGWAPRVGWCWGWLRMENPIKIRDDFLG